MKLLRNGAQAQYDEILTLLEVRVRAAPTQTRTPRESEPEKSPPRSLRSTCDR